MSTGGGPRWRALGYAVACAIALAALVYRVQDLGRYGFWNDEAWVALATRVAGFSQFRLSLGPTPILWAAALVPLARLGMAAEVTLRLLPLLFSVLTLWAAYRTGTHRAGLVGGTFALAAIGFDPASIQYAKLLKHYGAEAFLGLLAFDAAAAFARDHRTHHLVRLCLTLTLGLGFANTQLFVAPPLFAALLADTLVADRDWRRARTIALAGAGIALFDVAWVQGLVAPHLNAALTEYWADAYVPTSIDRAVPFVLHALGRMATPTWGPFGLGVVLVTLVVATAVSPEVRLTGVGIGLLLVELAVLSARRLVPFEAPRVMLFALTLLNVHLATGLALALETAWRRVPLRPLAVLVLAVVVADLARGHDWTTLGRAAQIEDLGPLVRTVEDERRPDDGVLLYQRSVFVWAYYQTPTPVLVPAPNSVGYAPRLDDPRIVLVQGADATRAVARVSIHPRIWFLGSRFREGDEVVIRRALATRGRVVREVTRPRALLLLVER
jgi:hypothetical protein